MVRVRNSGMHSVDESPRKDRSTTRSKVLMFRFFVESSSNNLVTEIKHNMH